MPSPPIIVSKYADIMHYVLLKDIPLQSVLFRPVRRLEVETGGLCGAGGDTAGPHLEVLYWPELHHHR